MRLSAIIPTHARPGPLRACLETLRTQDLEPERLEIVVVDDGSPDDVGSLVAEVCRDSAVAMRCERQLPSGLNEARNRGAAAASGEVLAFLDDDTLVSPAWARAMLTAFERHPCAGVGGRVQLDVTGPLPAWLAARRYYLAEYELGHEAHWLDGDPVPVGANCAVRRVDFERLGGFRTGLDRRAGSLVSNGDTEFFRRLRAAGGRLRYEPAAHVIHCVPADRLTIEFFTRRDFSQGVSDELMFAIERPLTRAGQIARLGRELALQLRPMTETVLRDLMRGRGTANGRLFASYWRGRVSAVLSGPRATGPNSAKPDSR
jgi:GT2 family glycosyltransferase